MYNILSFISQKIFYLPILYIAIGIVIYGILRKIIRYVLSLKTRHLQKNSGNYKKIETLRVLLQNIIKYIIGVLVILAILTVYGIDIGSILAGLGILGAVVGLALQDTFKDFFAGISILLENQFAIGDNIEIDGFRGDVIFLGLKTTKLRSYEGAVKIIANRNITNVTNYSLSSSLAIVDVAIANTEPQSKVEKILEDVAKELSDSLDSLAGPVELLGINELKDGNVTYRLTASTKPTENFGVERKIRKAVKERLDKEKIKIGYPNIEVYHGNK